MTEALITPQLLERHEQEVERIEACLNGANQRPTAPLQILEAGCGRRWDLRNLAFPYCLTGIDLDAEALRLRKEVARDLDIAIHGDLTVAEFPNQKFDVVYSSYVLEHITGAEAVLDRFTSWLRDGGNLVVRIPDGHSAYGTITRLSPHWFHVFYYRWILGNKKAGQPGYPPYQTIFDSVVSVQGLQRYAESRGLELVGSYRTAVDTAGNFRGQLVRLAIKAVEFLSFGKRTSSHCTLTYIFRKPNAGFVSAS